MEPTKNQGVVAKALDELAADVDKHFGVPLRATLAMIDEIRAMRFRRELEEAVAEGIRRLKGMGYRDAQIARILRGSQAVRDTVRSMAIK
jgi:hypothetical protein